LLRKYIDKSSPLILPCFRAAFLQCYLLTPEITKTVTKIKKSSSKFSLGVIKIYTKFQPKSHAQAKDSLVQTTAALPALGKIKTTPSDSSQTRPHGSHPLKSVANSPSDVKKPDFI